MEHLLEEVLQGEVHLQALAPGSQQLQELLPEPQDVVLPPVDALDVVVALQLQLLGHRLNGLHPLPVGSCVCLDGLVLLLGCLHRCQVLPKVVLPRHRARGEALVSSPGWGSPGWVVPLLTWATRRWFSLSQASRMAALRSKRRASCSSFS